MSETTTSLQDFKSKLVLGAKVKFTDFLYFQDGCIADNAAITSVDDFNFEVNFNDADAVYSHVDLNDADVVAKFGGNVFYVFYEGNLFFIVEFLND